MADDNVFRGFNKQGKGSGKSRSAEKRSSELTPVAKQIFFRLLDSSPMALTPAEKTALLALYQKAYPAFYAREIERDEDGLGIVGVFSAWWSAVTRWVVMIVRVAAWIVTGILIAAIAVVVIKIVTQ